MAPERDDVAPRAAIGPLAATTLVVLQFALLAVLAVAFVQGWPTLAGGALRIAAVLLLAMGGAVGVWAVATNRPGNFNVRPVPRAGARLVTGGPYRWIRHPMYTALLLAGAAAVVVRPGGGTIGAWLALCAVLASKALAEERGLAGDPAYVAYMRRTRRFLPGLL